MIQTIIQDNSEGQEAQENQKKRNQLYENSLKERDYAEPQSRIRSLRLERGFTISLFAKLMEISESSIARYEDGTRYPGKEVMNRMCQFFNVTPGYLMGYSDSRNENNIKSEETKLLVKYDASSDSTKNIIDSVLNTKNGTSQQNNVEDALPSEMSIREIKAEETTFKERLRMLRTNKGISVAMLAQEIGLSVSSVQQYESGKRYPSRKVQRIIADYFGVEIDYLIGKTEADDIKKLKTFKLSDEARAFEFLRKYRNADDTTKEIVDKLISREEQDVRNTL